MGQRHQAFLIARVRPTHGPPVYRCIGAFHHQWCFGTLPLRAVHRFLRLLQRKENAAVVRGELRDLDEKYERNERIPAAPCPYTVALLGVAWTTDLEQNHFTGVTLKQAILDANMGCWDGDNNDGISVIDITNLEYPRYCFLHPSRRREPTSAHGYLSHYYDLRRTGLPVEEVTDEATPDAEWLQLLFMSVVPLAGLTVISASTLREAWPSISWGCHDPEQDRLPRPLRPADREDHAMHAITVRYLRQRDGQAVDALPEDEMYRLVFDILQNALLGHPDPSMTRPAVLDLLQGPHIFNFTFEPLDLHVGDTSVAAQGGDMIVNVPPCTLESLRGMTSFPDDGLPFLIDQIHATADEFIDLSGFALSQDQIIQIISSFPNATSLDLSSNPRLLADDVPVILEMAPTVSSLTVMNCVSVDGRRLVELIRQQPYSFRRVEGIMHPTLLSITKTEDFPISFTFIYADHSYVSGVSMPFFTPNLVLQALADILPIAWREQSWSSRPNIAGDRGSTVLFAATMSAAMIAHTVFTTGSMPRHGQWGKRPVVSVPLQPHAVVSNDPRGSWAFFLDWEPNTSRKKWGFIRYAPEYETSLDASAYRSGEVYGLHEFLARMMDEGRPPPDPELVQHIEDILYARHRPDGTPVCPLMSSSDVPEVTTKIPQVGLDDGYSDFNLRSLLSVPGFSM